MEARIAGTSSGLRKKSLEWDLNDWRWDGNLCLARPINNPTPSDCTVMQTQLQLFSSQERDISVIERETSEPDKRRRIVAVIDEQDEEQDAIDLNEGANGTGEERNGEEERNGRSGEANQSRSFCVVDGCGIDLSEAKDYHRRHKVCPVHSKSSTVCIGGIAKRFCQQCSKFHLLEEFDEGKRSCRKRLDRHNGRRRKSNYQNATANPALLNQDQALSFIALGLLRILSNSEPVRSVEPGSQDLLQQLVKTLAGAASSSVPLDISSLLQNLRTPTQTNSPINGNTTTIATPNLNLTTVVHSNSNGNIETLPKNGSKVKDFDLNYAYFDQENENFGINEGENQISSSPQHTSGNTSDSVSARSLRSSENSQSRTGKVVFKLFGKDPSNVPLNLRPEILDWLSHCPSDMESFIKPGCIVLTLYLRLPDSAWEELGNNLTYWMKKLVNNTYNTDFWCTGWVYARAQDHMVFIYNGGVVVDGLSLSKFLNNKHKITSVTPIAVSHSSEVTFTVKGYNLSQSDARLICAFDGEYLYEKTIQDLVENGNISVQDGGPHSLTFTCSVPSQTGRGFIEIEEFDHSSLYFPFIVTEDERIRIEVRALEDEINHPQMKTEFLHELGWLLRRANQSDRATCPEKFPLDRYTRLVSFSMDREWCGVLRKLLETLFNGDINLNGRDPHEYTLNEGNLLFSAVRMKSRKLVSFLLGYMRGSEYIFRADIAVGPMNFTALHLAATIDGAESVVDALTDDPIQVGIKAWKSNRDDINKQTPEDCARDRAHLSYIQLVQNKIDSRSNKSHVEIDIPPTFQIEKGNSKFTPNDRPYCKRCIQSYPVQRNFMNRFLIHRPAMLTLVTIAAVCVCVGLILKSPPVVRYTKPPFLWESLKSGSM